MIEESCRRNMVIEIKLFCARACGLLVSAPCGRYGALSTKIDHVLIIPGGQ